MRMVLDTQVWIDWLVFDDPSVAALREAASEIVIDWTRRRAPPAAL